MADEKPARTFQDLSDSEIERLVDSLRSLQEGELGVDMLVACGPRAIPPLRRFLLQGSPSTVYLPRQRTVRALAGLGAKDVLIEFLRRSRTIADAELRFAEEGVLSTAARELAKWHTDDVFEALLLAGRMHLLPGIAEALGEFPRIEAVPLLIAALGDDFSREPASTSLAKIAAVARPFLIDAARTPDPSRRQETPSSLRRRASALRVLLAAGVPVMDWPRLRALGEDSDPEIAVTTRRIGLAFGPAEERTAHLQRLILLLPHCNWLLQLEIEEELLAHHDLARPLAQAALHREKLLGMGAISAVGILDKVARSSTPGEQRSG